MEEEEGKREDGEESEEKEGENEEGTHSPTTREGRRNDSGDPVDDAFKGGFLSSLNRGVHYNPSLSFPLTFAKIATRAAAVRLAASGGIRLKLSSDDITIQNRTRAEEGVEEMADATAKAPSESVVSRPTPFRPAGCRIVSRPPPNFVIRPRIGRGGRILYDRLHLPYRPELAAYMEDSARTLEKRSAVVAEARANLLRSWGVPFNARAVAALGEILPSSFTLPAAYKTLLAKSNSEGVGREGTHEFGPLPCVWRKDGATTAFTHFPALFNSQLGTQSLIGAGPLLDTCDPLSFAHASSTLTISAGSHSGDAMCPKVPTHSTCTLAALFSPHLEDVLNGAAAAAAAADDSRVRSSDSDSRQGALGILREAGNTQGTTPQVPLPMAILRNASMRFAAGLDALPAFPRHIPERLPNASSVTVHEARFADIQRDPDSDDEGGRVGLTAVGAFGSSWKDPQAGFHAANLSAYERAIPLRG